MHILHQRLVVNEIFVLFLHVKLVINQKAHGSAPLIPELLLEDVELCFFWEILVDEAFKIAVAVESSQDCVTLFVVIRRDDCCHCDYHRFGLLDR